MLTFFYMFAAIVLLMVLVSVAYRSGGNKPEPEPEPDRRLDKLVTVLDPEVMEEIIRRARSENVSEVAILNRLLRTGLFPDQKDDRESPPHS